MLTSNFYIAVYINLAIKTKFFLNAKNIGDYPATARERLFDFYNFLLTREEFRDVKKKDFFKL